MSTLAKEPSILALLIPEKGTQEKGSKEKEPTTHAQSTLKEFINDILEKEKKLLDKKKDATETRKEWIERKFKLFVLSLTHFFLPVLFKKENKELLTERIQTLVQATKKLSTKENPSQ